MPKYEPLAWVGDDTYHAAHYLNDRSVSRSVSVIDDDSVPMRTGLLNQHGVPLYRMPDKAKCGFGR